MNIATRLLNSNPYDIEKIEALTTMIRPLNKTWGIRFHLANILLQIGKPNEAKDLISAIDITKNDDDKSKQIITDIYFTEYIQKLKVSSQLKLPLMVLIRCGFHEIIPSILENNLKNYDTTSQMDLRIFTSLTLLTMNHVHEATKIISKLSPDNISLKTIDKQNKIRLIFLWHMLSEDNYFDSSRLHEVINSTRELIVEASLYEYLWALSRRVESSFNTPYDIKAARWVADALHLEYSTLTIKNKNIVSLARWMVLSGKVAKILNIVENIYKTTETKNDIYLTLAIMLWIKEYGDKSISCFNKERLNHSTDPATLFTRTASFAIFSSSENTYYWLKKLYNADKLFFTHKNIITHWGFLSLILKKIGEDNLSVKAFEMAAKKDKYNEFRKQLWCTDLFINDKYKFPNFTMPDEFDHTNP